jgi:anti-sigma B factor antagonist
MEDGVRLEEDRVGNEQIIPGFDEETCDYLEIRLRRIEGQDTCLAVELRGSIDAYNTNFLRRSVMKAVDAGFVQLVLVLPGVDYVSSTGVGTLLGLLRTLMEKGGGMTLVDPHPRVTEILKLMHLHTFFSCSDSVDEALLSPAGRLPDPVFPKKVNCPICDKALRSYKPGRFRCPNCKTTITVDRSGKACL